MKRYGTDRKSRLRRLLCVLSVLTLCLAACTAAAADAGNMLLDDPDIILARDAAARLSLTMPDGSPLNVRGDPSAPSRGKACPDGSEPDYSGLIGFAAMNRDPAVNLFSVFDKAYWTVSNYIIKEGRYVKVGLIAHKTPVVIVSQSLQPDGNGNYKGYLEAIRLDTGNPCILKVGSFVTLAYWKLPVREIPAYGYCIAIYRETPGEGPRDEDGNACLLRDGTRVLIPAAGDVPGSGPNPQTLQVQGIVFREEADGSITQKTVYFRENDLVPNY